MFSLDTPTSFCHSYVITLKGFRHLSSILFGRGFRTHIYIIQTSSSQEVANESICKAPEFCAGRFCRIHGAVSSRSGVALANPSACPELDSFHQWNGARFLGKYYSWSRCAFDEYSDQRRASGRNQ